MSFDISQSGRHSLHGRSHEEVAGLKKIHVGSLRDELQRLRRNSSGSLSSLRTHSRKNSMKVKVGDGNGQVSLVQQQVPSLPPQSPMANPSIMDHSATLEHSHLSSVPALDETLLSLRLNNQPKQTKDLLTSARLPRRRENSWSKDLVLSLGKTPFPFENTKTD
jgi:hypothetical protein